MRFEGDADKAAANLAKHGVSFEAAKEVFFDPFAIETYDADHSNEEDRFIRIGLSRSGVLLVAFTERMGEVMRIISARAADWKEREAYEQQRGS
jgi:uncharacterized protein